MLSFLEKREKMFRIILLFLILINISYAQNRRYFIKLGSFRQFSVLEKTINKMPQSLRSHITIVKSNGWFIPFAYNTKQKRLLSKKLPAYRRYFYDAYVYSSEKILNSPVVRTYVKLSTPRYKNIEISQKDNSISYYSDVRVYPTARTYSIESKPAKIPEPTVITTEKNFKGFNKRMISGKRYYLAYKSTNSNPNLLVKVSFGNHTVVYQPMLGDMSMRDAQYLVENGKLYMFADTFSENGAFSKIDGYEKDYILVSSWSNGKKLNTLRYYYKLNDAKRYLGLKGSTDPLATALEDSPIQGVYLPNY
jgi:hypothetical protein